MLTIRVWNDVLGGETCLLATWWTIDDAYTVAVLRGGWVGHGSPRFLAGPPLGLPSFFLKFTFKFAWLTYTADNFQPANFLTIWRLKTFWRRFWRYSQVFVGFHRFNHSKPVFITMENHHAGETFMLAPDIFSLAPQCPPQFFHSRIATAHITH